MKKVNKSGLIATIIITVALLAILSVVTWAIPMNNKGSGAFIAAYVCAMVVILGEGILTIVVLFIEDSLSRKILGLPILYYGLVTTIFQLLLTIIFFVANAFVVVPAWVIVVLECLIFIMAIIHITIGFFFKGRTAEFKNGKQATAFIDILRVRVQVIVSNNSNKELEKPLQDLYETLKGTDPVANELTVEVDQKLDIAVANLKDRVDANASSDEIRELISSVDKLIKERAAYCKAGK